MNFDNIPINRDEQMQKIVEDTEEIIKNFKEISELITKKIDQKDEAMLKLGKKVILNQKDDSLPNYNLGSEQIKLI